MQKPLHIRRRRPARAQEYALLATFLERSPDAQTIERLARPRATARNHSTPRQRADRAFVEIETEAYALPA
jgi:hypothetical protein